jgi:iron only hydrogenase large subunit-like protein
MLEISLEPSATHHFVFRSTVKSPQQVMGTLVKEHFAKAIGVE